MGREDLEKPGKVNLRACSTLHTYTHTHTHTYTLKTLNKIEKFPHLGTFHTFFLVNSYHNPIR